MPSKQEKRDSRDPRQLLQGRHATAIAGRGGLRGCDIAIPLSQDHVGAIKGEPLLRTWKTAESELEPLLDCISPGDSRLHMTCHEQLRGRLVALRLAVALCMIYIAARGD